MNLKALIEGLDVNSPTWRAVVRFLENELKVARGKLEASGTSPEETEGLRGRIGLAKSILGLSKVEPIIPPQDGSYHAGR